MKNTPTTTVVKQQVKAANGNTVTKTVTVPINGDVIARLSARIEKCDALESKIEQSYNWCNSFADEAQNFALQLHEAHCKIGTYNSYITDTIEKQFQYGISDLTSILKRAADAAEACLSVRMRQNWETEEFLPPIPLK